MKQPGGSAQLVPVDQESRGRLIRDRRVALGIMSVREFAKATGLSRNAVTAAEAGDASEITYARLEAWLDNFEHEIGSEAEEAPKTVTIKMSGDFGVEIVVEGPVSSPDERAWLLAAARDLLHEAQEGRGSDGATK
jgi:transcriptional regulator with XRE-family HTH domain